MFDNIINNAKGSVNMMLMFFVAGIIGMTIGTLVDGGAFDIQAILTFGVSAAVAGFATSLVMGCVKG
ncbi:MAG: hypothetical protein IH995_07575 [Proteobacteria bacterium]|nr:hypothetical protein [Pseudomonadota bacterium]